MKPTKWLSLAAMSILVLVACEKPPLAAVDTQECCTGAAFLSLTFTGGLVGGRTFKSTSIRIDADGAVEYANFTSIGQLNELIRGTDSGKLWQFVHTYTDLPLPVLEATTPDAEVLSEYYPPSVQVNTRSVNGLIQHRDYPRDRIPAALQPLIAMLQDFEVTDGTLSPSGVYVRAIRLPEPSNEIQKISADELEDSEVLRQIVTNLFAFVLTGPDTLSPTIRTIKASPQPVTVALNEQLLLVSGYTLQE